MKITHVSVNALALRERLETDPTCVCMAPSARHVVAPFCTLDGRGAARAVFHVVAPHPLLEQTVAAVLTVRAGDTLVVFDVTRRANTCETGRASYYGVPWACWICLRAVRRRAVVILIWACLHVSMEGRQRKSFEISGVKGVPHQPNRYQGRALALIAKATDGKGPSVRRRSQISNKARLAPFVTAARIDWRHGGIETHRTMINARFCNLP